MRRLGGRVLGNLVRVPFPFFLPGARPVPALSAGGADATAASFAACVSRYSLFSSGPDDASKFHLLVRVDVVSHLVVVDVRERLRFRAFVRRGPLRVGGILLRRGILRFDPRLEIRRALRRAVLARRLSRHSLAFSWFALDSAAAAANAAAAADLGSRGGGGPIAVCEGGFAARIARSGVRCHSLHAAVSTFLQPPREMSGGVENTPCVMRKRS